MRVSLKPNWLVATVNENAKQKLRRDLKRGKITQIALTWQMGELPGEIWHWKLFVELWWETELW